MEVKDYITKDYRKGFIQRRIRNNWAEIRYSISRFLNRTTGGTAASSTLVAFSIAHIITQSIA